MFWLELQLQELNGRITHMVTESQKKKRQLDTEHTETHLAQVCLLHCSIILNQLQHGSAVVLGMNSQRIGVGKKEPLGNPELCA